jgi:hypothetical protein
MKLVEKQYAKYFLISVYFIFTSGAIIACSQQKSAFWPGRLTTTTIEYAESKFPNAHIEGSTVIFTDHGSSWLAHVSPQSPYTNQQGQQIWVLDGDLWVLIDKRTGKPTGIYESRTQVPS